MLLAGRTKHHTALSIESSSNFSDFEKATYKKAATAEQKFATTMFSTGTSAVAVEVLRLLVYTLSEYGSRGKRGHCLLAWRARVSI